MKLLPSYSQNSRSHYQRLISIILLELLCSKLWKWEQYPDHVKCILLFTIQFFAFSWPVLRYLWTRTTEKVSELPNSIHWENVQTYPACKRSDVFLMTCWNSPVKSDTATGGNLFDSPSLLRCGLRLLANLLPFSHPFEIVIALDLWLIRKYLISIRAKLFFSSRWDYCRKQKSSRWAANWMLLKYI